MPNKYSYAKDYNCPYFDNANNVWYLAIKDKIAESQKKEK